MTKLSLSLTMHPDDLNRSELMPLDTPILKVSRPVAACLRCRTAKIKCDGKLPACTSCERTGKAAECTSTNDQFARGKERSYVSTLETRIERLQARIEEAQRRKPSVVSIPDDETTVPASSSRKASIEPMPDSVTLTTKASRRKEVSAIDDLVSDFGFLSVNATARDFYGFSSAMSYARLILWACSREALPEGTTKALPPRHTTTSLLQRYLSVLHPLIPVVQESTLYLSVNNVYDNSRADALDHWMVRVVLAIASASLSERGGDQFYLDAIGHVCAALEHSESVLRPGSISSIQALVLLVEYALLDPHHFDAWSLVGVASRAMVDLGLHQDPSNGAPMQKGKLELRRRVFWSVYVLDRSTSLVQSRAFSFSDDSAKVKVPFVKRTRSAATSPASEPDRPKLWTDSHDQALDLIALRTLQSSWYTDLFQSGRSAWDEPYSYIWQVCDEMRKWYTDISTTCPPEVRSYFELELLYSYIYVLAPSPRVPAIAPYASMLIFEFCIRYADLLLVILSSAQTIAPVNFNDAMRAYMTGRFFLDILQQNTDALLSGVTPSRPEVRPSAPAPPTMPEVQHPPPDQLPYFNTIRAISCIRKLTECLSRFGQRWGYLSWSTLYSEATAPMSELLIERQRTFEVMAGIRRPSVWHGPSHGSSVGSIGNIDRQSANNSISTSNANFGSIYSSAVQPVARETISTSPPQPSPPLYQKPEQWQHGNSITSLYHPPSQSSIASASVQPSSGQGSTTSRPGEEAGSFVGTSISTTPHQQFGAWGGYTATSLPDTLDQENAVPPDATWDTYRT